VRVQDSKFFHFGQDSRTAVEFRCLFRAPFLSVRKAEEGGGISSVGACEGEGEFYFSCLYLEQDVWAPTRHSPVKSKKNCETKIFYSDKIDTVTTRNNIRASVVIALYSMSAIRELSSKSGNTFI
jgi:hypothetical protein